MRSRYHKRLRKLAVILAMEKLKSYLSEEEAKKVTPDSIKVFEANQDSYMYDGEKLVCTPFSTRWFYRQLKKGKIGLDIQEVSNGQARIPQAT